MNVKSLRFGLLLLLPVFSGVMSVTEAQTKKLSATVDFARYRLSQGTNRLHVTFAVDAASLNMVKQTNDTYEGSLVMHLVVEGLPNKLIADQLDISVRTVEVHRARVFDKMEVKSAVELANLMRSLS